MKDGGTALKSYTYLTDKLHLSADAAGQLVTATKLSGQNTEDAFDAMGDQLTAFNKTNKRVFIFFHNDNLIEPSIVNTTKGDKLKLKLKSFYIKCLSFDIYNKRRKYLSIEG